MGRFPLLEWTTVTRWPPITAGPLSSQSLAFLAKIIELFLPPNGRIQRQTDKTESQVLGKGCNIDDPLQQAETPNKGCPKLRVGLELGTFMFFILCFSLYVLSDFALILSLS